MVFQEISADVKGGGCSPYTAKDLLQPHVIIFLDFLFQIDPLRPDPPVPLPLHDRLVSLCALYPQLLLSCAQKPFVIFAHHVKPVPSYSPLFSLQYKVWTRLLSTSVIALDFRALSNFRAICLAQHLAHGSPITRLFGSTPRLVHI